MSLESIHVVELCPHEKRLDQIPRPPPCRPFIRQDPRPDEAQHGTPLHLLLVVVVCLEGQDRAPVVGVCRAEQRAMWRAFLERRPALEKLLLEKSIAPVLREALEAPTLEVAAPGVEDPGQVMRVSPRCLAAEAAQFLAASPSNEDEANDENDGEG